MKRPTRNDVARIAQVSGATVSRVLAGRPGLAIADETRSRVVAAAEELGYRPNMAARTLVTGRTHTLALWLSDRFTPFEASVAAHVTREAGRRGFRVSVQYQDASVTAARAGAGSLELMADGLLVCDLSAQPSSYVDRMRSPGLPWVSMGVHHPDQGDYVGVDLGPAVWEALEHLAAAGRRRIAFMTYSGSYPSTDPRDRAYEQFAAGYGRDPELIYSPGHGRAAAREAIRAHVHASGCPDAIFCFNDDVAIGCYRGLLDLRIAVPEDVALAGCDGIEDAEYLERPITTIVQPVREMCAAACEFMERRIQDPLLPPQRLVLKPRLEIRCSSGGAAPRLR